MAVTAAPPAPAARRAGQRLGRFRLIAELGRGAQATVWRAHDERLDREVAVKLLNREVADAGRPPGQWLHEARAVSRLAHAHIVPVFDADEIDGQALLVFELVQGPTLVRAGRQSGPMPAREAVELMLGVVDALRAAHALGIVHRDLKPSNILLDADGRARVMDFGIAARLADAAAGPAQAPAEAARRRIFGTPGYLSPEAAAGLAATPQMDVFSAGLVLAELLAGAPMIAERDPREALRRVRQQDLALPDHADADDRLRAVVQRAIARDPAARYDSAASLRDALMQWLAPSDDAALAVSTGHGTLDFLLRRMRHKTDFPALTDHVLRIQRMASSESENLNHLADEILKDVALTQKLLRLVNTVQYRRSGHAVSTVSRAVALVGLAGIRNLALSLVLVEHMKDKAHAQRLKEGFLRSLLAGQLAHALGPGARDAEEAFLAAMFYNLGSLLTEYYFPEEAEAIRQHMQAAAPGRPGSGVAGPDLLRGRTDVAADRAAGLVLGLSFEALGVGVARHWGLPDALQRSMRRPEGASPSHAVGAGPERLRWLAVASNEMAEALWQGDEVTLRDRLDAVALRHGRVLGLNSADLWQASGQARLAIAQMAPAMGLALPVNSGGARLLTEPARPDLADSLSPHQLQAHVQAHAQAAPSAAGAAGARPQPAAAGATGAAQPAASPGLRPDAPAHLRPLPAAAEVLAAGIHDITETLAGDSFKLNQVLRMVLETMMRAHGFQRMVFCLRDAASGRLTGRFGLGDRAAALSPQFQIALQWSAGQVPDLFGAVCLKARDTLIADTRLPGVEQRLPAWYRQQVNAPSLLLLPMVMKGAPFAVIYADQARSGQLQLAEQELALLRTLRNQAVMAFRQTSGASA